MAYTCFYDADEQPRAGLVKNGQVHPYQAGMTLADVINNRAPLALADPLPLNTLRLAPLLRPGKILCVGRNYIDHAAELKNTVPIKPLIFAKFATSIIANGQTIRWRRSITNQVDWEGELAVIIGRRAQAVSEADALDYVFGYTVANDISARDIQDAESQWTRAKGQDTFCPLGPVIVPATDVYDPHVLKIITIVNGEVMQNGNTGDMVFKVPFLISYLSRTFTLEPGDLILTGTPAGVGKGMKPPRFLQDGDEVSVTIDGLGTLSNPCQIIND